MAEEQTKRWLPRRALEAVTRQEIDWNVHRHEQRDAAQKRLRKCVDSLGKAGFTNVGPRCEGRPCDPTGGLPKHFKAGPELVKYQCAKVADEDEAEAK